MENRLHFTKKQSSRRRIARLTYLAIVGSLLVWFVGPAQPAVADGAVVSGKVTEPNGTISVSGATVTLRTSNWSSSWNTTTGSDGAYSFTNIPAGTYKLDVWTNHPTFFNPEVQTVTVSGTTTLLDTVKLLNANFFCKVTLPDGTTGVSGASVTVRTSDWSVSRYATTDAAGNCKQALTTNATYTIETYTNHPTKSRPDNLSLTYSGGNVYFDGTNNSSVIKMNEPAVTGYVKLADGSVVQYISVTLYDSNKIGVQYTSTDSTGFFKLDGVPSGSYTLQISPPNSPGTTSGGLAAPEPIALTLTKGVTNTTYQTNAIVLSPSVKKITGTITRQNGNPVTDGNVSAWQRNGGGWTNTTVNSQGQYTLTASSGGDWQLSIWPNWTAGSSPDWTYEGTGQLASFTKANSVAETVTVDLSVVTLSATLTGTVTLPNGSAPPATDYFSVSAWRDFGNGNWSQVGANGGYSMRLAPGTYQLSVYGGGSSEYGTLQLSVTVKENETLTYNVRLLARTATIAGTVRDTAGRGIANQSCSAWQKDGSGWGWGSTNSEGAFSFKVIPGTYFASCFPSAGHTATSLTAVLNTSTSYVSTDPPQEVTVGANGTVSVPFVFQIADATLKGKLLDPEGNSLTTIWGWAEVSKCATTTANANFHFGGLGGSIDGGTFTIRVPEGCWRLGANLGYGGSYSAASTSVKEVTVKAGETIENIELRLVPNNAEIQLNFKDSSGNLLTKVYGSVWADNGVGGHQWGSVTNGQATLKVAAGDWHVGCWVDPLTGAQYYLEGACDSKATAVANQTKVLDVVLKQADSTVTIKTVDPSGKPLASAYVLIDTSFGTVKTVSYASYGSWFNRDKLSDQNGQAVLNVPAGTYFVWATLPPDQGFMNPEREVVTTSSSVPATVTLTFRTADAVITGTVSKEDGTKYTGEALVWGWSDEGGYSETTASTDGNYELNCTKDETWHVGAADQSGTTGYRSEEKTVTVPATGTATASLTVDDTTLAKASTSTVNTNTTSTLDVGAAELTIPQNSLSTENKSVTISVTPTVEATNSATDSLLDGVAYDLNVVQASGSNVGQPITNFPTDVTVCLGYSESTLTTHELQESDLTAKYWNEDAGVWDDPKTVVVNEDTNEVCLTTNHFTKFAITTAPVERKRPTTTGPGGTTPTPGGGVTTPSEQAPVISPDVVELSTKQLVVLSAGQGPRLYLYNPDGRLARTIRPYGSRTAGSFAVVAANVAGDKTEELIVWETSGRQLPIKIFSLTGSRLGTIASGRLAGLTVTPVDADGDGVRELLLTSTGSPAGSLYQYQAGKFAKQLTISSAATTGQGLQAAAGNLTGGAAEEIVFASVGGRPAVSVYQVDLQKDRATRIARRTDTSLSAKGTTISLADVTGSGTTPEIILRPTVGSGRLSVVSLTGRSLKTVDRLTVTGDLTLATRDLTGDGKVDFVFGSSQTGRLRLASVVKDRLKILGSTRPFSRSQPAIASLVTRDFDADGTAEVAVSQPVGRRVKVLQYSGRKIKTVASATLTKATASAGLVLTATDLNGDGRSELIASPLGSGTTVTLLSFVAGKTLTVSSELQPVGKTAKRPYAVVAATAN